LINDISSGRITTSTFLFSGIPISTHSKFYGQDFECVDMGIPENKKVEVVIRPEDISLIKAEEGFTT
jgi:hypothetical protein